MLAWSRGGVPLAYTPEVLHYLVLKTPGEKGPVPLVKDSCGPTQVAGTSDIYITCLFTSAI